VPGAEAAKFDFTSALAAELLKIVRTSLIPMMEASGAALSPFTNEEPLPNRATAASAPADTDSEGTVTFQQAEAAPKDITPVEATTSKGGQGLRQKLRRSIILPPPG